ncbi:MAG: hypothetical protein R2798_09275 [Chitinophagales bacterium]|nr:hypothetical protein [Bacteroidota bacterium]
MSSTLFELIQSLSPTEKAYFKKFYQKYGKTASNKYVRFFDILAKMKVYEKEKMTLLLKKNKLATNFSATQNYLYNAILDTFQPIINKQDEENKLLQEIAKIRFLLDKKLYSHCTKRIIRLKKTAYELQEFECLLKILKIEINITYYASKEVSERRKLLKECEIIEHYLQNETQAFLLLCQAEDVLFDAGLAAQKDYPQLLDELQAKLVQLASEPYLSVQTVYYLQHGLSDVFVAKKEYANAFYPIERILKTFDKHPKLKISKLNHYIQTIINYCNRMVSAELCNSLDDLKYISSVIKNLAKKTTIPEVENQYIAATLSHVKYAIYLAQHDIPKAMEMAEIIEACPIPMQRNKALYLLYNYEFAQVHFYAKKWHECTTYLYNILNDENRQLFPDVYLFTRILYLLVLTETEEIELFYAQYDSLRKAIAKAPHKAILEESLAKMLYRYNKIINKKERTLFLKEYIQELHEIEKQVPTSFMFFKIYHWIEEKTQHIH